MLPGAENREDLFQFQLHSVSYYDKDWGFQAHSQWIVVLFLNQELSMVETYIPAVISPHRNPGWDSSQRFTASRSSLRVYNLILPVHDGFWALLLSLGFPEPLEARKKYNCVLAVKSRIMSQQSPFLSLLGKIYYETIRTKFIDRKIQKKRVK